MRNAQVIRYAVFYNFNLLRRYSVDFGKQLHSLVAHHNYFDSCFIDFADDVLLQERRLFQNSMKNYGEWNFQPINEGKDIQSRLSPKNSKFVIENTSLGVTQVDVFRSIDIIFAVVLTDNKLDLRRVIILLQRGGVVNGCYVSVNLYILPHVQGYGFTQVLCECTNPALSGRVCSNVSNFHLFLIFLIV